MNNTDIISYGISINYLKHWGTHEALREVFQNFMDYGEYHLQTTIDESTNNATISIKNSYEPNDLTFLAVGNSEKESVNARGKYGEGLKMAFLVFIRNGFSIEVYTQGEKYYPIIEETRLGTTLAIKIEPVETFLQGFKIVFSLPLLVWEDYQSKVIKKEDIMFNHPQYGSIVDRDKGNIYCGGLFVRNVNNLTYAYDILPEHLSLDRDRSLPSTFDVNWATSKIKQAYGKTKIEDFTYSDTEYIDEIPANVKKQIRPRLIGNTIVPTYQSGGKTVVINNTKVKTLIENDSFFAKTIKRIKLFLMKQLGLYDMLKEFERKHVHGEQAKKDFKLILMKVEENG